MVIISDRHLSFLRSVPEIFGTENHAYYYRHLKEKFSTFLNGHNTKGKKGQEGALQWLDSIAYARRDEYYYANLSELQNYNEALAKWVEENAPEH